QSKRITKKSDDVYELVGDLTIRGTTREVSRSRARRPRRERSVGQAPPRLHRDRLDRPQGVRRELQPGARPRRPRARREGLDHDRSRSDGGRGRASRRGRVVTAAVSQSPAPPRKALLWTGRVISVLPALGLLASASMKLSHSPQVVAMFTNKLGYQESSLTGLALLEIAC